MKETTRIEIQLKRALEGEAWHGPALLELLAGVSATSANARPIPGAHTIWEIVLHLAAWHRAVSRRLEGERVNLSPEEDWPAVTNTGEAAWKQALETLHKSYQLLHTQLSNLKDSQLDEAPSGSNHSIYVMLHGLIQHDLYHAGQIALLKKALSRRNK